MEERLGRRASPARARSLFTVRAAISSARSSEFPRSSNPSLMWSYWRSRVAVHLCCGIVAPLPSNSSNDGSLPGRPPEPTSTLMPGDFSKTEAEHVAPAPGIG